MTDGRRVEPSAPAIAVDTSTHSSRPGARAVDAAEALDEAVLEGVPAAQVPAVAPRSASSSDGGAPASQPPRSARDSSPGARRARGRMAIRIPDDEVSRPTLASFTEPTPHVTAARARPSSDHTPTTPQVLPPTAFEPPPAPTLQPTRIISIDSPPEARQRIETRPFAEVVDTPARLPPHSQEDSWTPFQPTAADAAERNPPVNAFARPPSASEDLIPVEADSEPIIDAAPVLDGPDSAEPLDIDDAESQVVSAHGVAKAAPHVIVPSRPPPAPPVVATQAASARGSRADSSEVSKVRAAAPMANVRATAPTEPEGVDVRFDDDDPAPKPAAARAARGSSSEQEIAPEDLVSVESSPRGATPRDVDSQSTPSALATNERPSDAKAPSPKQPSKPALGSLGAPTPAVAFVSPGGARARAPSFVDVPPMRSKAPSIPPPVPPVKAGAATPGTVTTRTTPRPPLVIVPPHAGVAPPQSDGVGSRRKARPWWEELFNDDYIRTMAKISDEQIAREADFIEDSLGVARGGTMLDLCCGTGRHAIELSRRGYEVVGFDLSLAMLARAADEAQEREQKLNFVQGDVREMTFDEAFDGVYCWNTSFGFFDEDTNAKVVERVHKSLKKGGQFVLDVLNRDFVAHQAPSLAWFEGDGCVCMDEMSIDWITSRMRVKRTMMMDDGRSKEIEYTIRIYSLHELGKILHDMGFRVAEVSGRVGTPGVFFGGESPRTLILAEKR